MGQQPRDCILNANLQRTGFPFETNKRFFAEALTKPVEVGVSCQNWIVRTGFRKNNFIGVRAVFERHAHHLFYFRGLLRSVMCNADFYRTEIAVYQFSANTDYGGYPKFDLMHVCVTSNP